MDLLKSSVKVASFVVLGIVALIGVVSIILFLLGVLFWAAILAVAAFVGWLVWLWVKPKLFPSGEESGIPDTIPGR